MSFLLAPLTTRVQGLVGVRLLVIVGVMMMSLSLSLVAVVRDVSMMLIGYGIICGLGMTCVINPPFALLDAYFPHSHPRQAFATGVVACSCSLGRNVADVAFFQRLVSVFSNLAVWAVEHYLIVVAVNNFVH
jgi:MFS family permease